MSGHDRVDRRARRCAVAVISMMLVASLGWGSTATSDARPFLGTLFARPPATGCAGGAVVVVGGTGDPEARAMLGVTQRFTGLGPDGLPDPDSPFGGSNARRILYADYPATIWPLGATGYDRSVRLGVTATEEVVVGYQRSCPGRPVVVAGFSQGARVAGDAMSDIGAGRAGLVRPAAIPGIRSVPRSRVRRAVDPRGLSAELYSDPRRAGDKTSRGIELSLVGVMPGLTMEGPRRGQGPRGFGVLEDRVISVCVTGDAICDLADPLFDPIGAVDGLLGYFTKHGLYPWHMYRDPRLDWANGRRVECGHVAADRGADGVDCLVRFDSAITELLRDLLVGIGSSGDIRDVLANRPTFAMPRGFELAQVQPIVRALMNLVPPLPELGFGAHLPELAVFVDIVMGILTLSPERLARGLRGLADSLRSIVLWPVNLVRHILDRLRPLLSAA